MTDTMIQILDMVASERGRQEFLKSQGKFAYCCSDKEISHAECCTVLAEEAGEVAHEVNEGIGKDRYIDKRRLLKELIETAAVAVGWAEKTLNEIETDAENFGARSSLNAEREAQRSLDTVRELRRQTAAKRETDDYEGKTGGDPDVP